MENEEFKVLTYNQALELVTPKILELIGNRKLKAFCKKNELNYRVVVMMCSDTNTREFPDVLHQLLEIFGYKAEREKAFKVFNIYNK
ncbi:MAG: hypothetical protein GXX85_00855 [Ignavibacteria bacterium]|nr:hypothetical protein [Ignavibacteria bacterium]